MIQFDFRSPSKTEVTLERVQQLEKSFLERLGNFKKEFEDAETYVDYNVDAGSYSISCKKDFSNLIDRFQQYQIEKNQTDSNIISPSDDIAP